jgi:uncharacterized membrane protein YkvA (DUF1232 family)
MSQRRYREITILVPEDDPAVAGAPGTGRGADPTDDGSDAFPGEQFGALVRRMPRYLRLAWGLAGEPSLPRSRKAAVIGAAAYLASPVDLVPGVIPVVGQLDDVAISILALRAALRALDEPTRLRVLADAGMTQEDLDQDLATVGLTASWLARRGVALGVTLGRLAAVTAARTVRTGARLGGRVAARLGPTVASGTRAAATRVGTGATGLAGALSRGARTAGRAVGDRAGRPGSGSPGPDPQRPDPCG